MQQQSHSYSQISQFVTSRYSDVSAHLISKAVFRFLPYTLPFGRTVPPLAWLVSSPLESRVLRSLLPPVRGSTASSVPLAPGSSLKTGLSSSSSGILSRLSSEMRDRACSFFRRPGGIQFS